jgi:predicted nuclease with TOPRIM domain
MNIEISNKISEIKNKFFELKDKLASEIQEKNNLTIEIDRLNLEKNDYLSTIESQSEEIKFLKEQLEEEKSKRVESPVPVDRDLEIDFLVKEIDQCINQIKTNL